MHKPWKTVVGFALLGLVITAISYAYTASYDYTKPMNGLRFATTVVSLILCPPQLLFVACIDCEVIGRGGLIMYSIIGTLTAFIRTLASARVGDWQEPGTISVEGHD